ncbi:MAG TPA: FlgD immunoglobulin-like domain containing protein, partial [bacterium]|nr:FlgD immunoglobulin-like domain containing protein [bacterium]
DILLAVYDIAGRPVRELTAGSRAAGAHAVNWDSRDAAGDRVPPGIYFYRLEGADFDVTRKLVVIR